LVLCAMAFAPEPTTLPLKGSPSLLCNNFSVNDRFFAYVHLGEVVVGSVKTAEVSPDKAHRIACKEVLMQTKLVSFSGGVNLLVAAGHRSVQVWEPAESKKIFMHTLPEPTPASQEHENYSCGITVAANGAQSYLLVGTSHGGIIVFEADKYKFGTDRTLSHELHTTPITDLCSQQETSGTGTHFASADLAGNIVVWAVAGFQPCATFPAPTAHPCTAIKMRGTKIYAAYSTGHIRVFDWAKNRKVCEIAAHARIINALDLHPSKDWLASVAEDTYAIVWDMTGVDSKVVTPLLTGAAADCLLTGTKFVDDQLMAVTYDQDHLRVWKLA